MFTTPYPETLGTSCIIYFPICLLYNLKISPPPPVQDCEHLGHGVEVALQAGEASLHHMHTLHRSGPAAVSAQRRVGVAIR